MTLSSLVLYVFYLLLPICIIYIAYLIVTKAFKEMGFSSVEAILIVFASFLLGSGLVDRYVGIPFSNIPLFLYQNWQVGVNIGGAVIPILISVYLFIKYKLPVIKTLMSIIIVAIITYGVTFVDPERGIVSAFPLWLLPVLYASIGSVFLMWKTKKKAAPVAYLSGTMGVLIGADVFHLVELLLVPVTVQRNAVIGGAHVFDMVFLTGILAVFLDGLLLYHSKRKKKDEGL